MANTPCLGFSLMSHGQRPKLVSVWLYPWLMLAKTNLTTPTSLLSSMIHKNLAREKSPTIHKDGALNEAEGTRTLNLRIDSPML